MQFGYFDDERREYVIWVMIAETVLGHGDRAHEYYLRINPSAREAIVEVEIGDPGEQPD
ncbi:MAG: GH36-type glycosyl hydrolase domain-containing protein [Anaerolineae bacterium]